MADTSGELPVVDVGDLGVPDRPASVAGVLLAAGESRRFDDRNKLLAHVEGEPVVARAARTFVGADVDFRTVVAVVGHEAGDVCEALAGFDVTVVENPEYEAGQSTSVRAGVAAVDDVDAAVFGLGDMPAVKPATVETLVTAYRCGVGDALASACDGRRGNPVLFGESRFDALADVTGDSGGRDVLLGSDDAALVETGDPGVLEDVDRPGDLDELG